MVPFKASLERNEAEKGGEEADGTSRETGKSGSLAGSCGSNTVVAWMDAVFHPEAI